MARPWLKGCMWSWGCGFMLRRLERITKSCQVTSGRDQQAKQTSSVHGTLLGGFFTSRKSMFGLAIYLMIWPPVESEDKNLVFNHISIDSVKGKFSSRCLPMQNLRSDNHLAANYESKALADNPKQDNQTTKPNMQLAWQWLLNGGLQVSQAEKAESHC